MAKKKKRFIYTREGIRPKVKITKVTSRINPYLPWDILDLYFNDKPLYEKVMSSSRYDVSQDVRDFLKVYRYNRGSRYQIRENYITTFREFRDRRTSMAELVRISKQYK